MRTFLACLLVFVLAAACSESEPERRAQATPSPAPVEMVNGGPCPEAELDRLDDRAGCMTTAHTDDETLFVYAITDSDSLPVRWRIRYESDSVEIDQPLDAGNPFSYPRALAAIDINDDGDQEWLIKAVDLAGHGTNWQRLHVFFADDERLRVLSYEGQPLYINVAGISRMGEGARCEDARFVLLRAEAQNRQNTIWEYSERVLEIEPPEATLITRREGKLRLTDYNDPDLDPYYRLECGDFVYP